MQKFYQTKLCLICISAIIANCEGVNTDTETAVEDKILPLSHIAAITDGKLQRNKRGLLDYLLSELSEYFDYGNEDDSEEDEKYLICRNCTIVISQSETQSSQPTKPSITEAAMPNGAAKPPTDPSIVAPKPEPAANNPNESPVIKPVEGAEQPTT